LAEKKGRDFGVTSQLEKEFPKAAIKRKKPKKINWGRKGEATTY